MTAADWAKAPCGSIPEVWKRLLADLAAREAERDDLRETNTRLNRRCQEAEAAAAQTVAECRHAGVSLGRALANYAAKRAEAGWKLAAEGRDHWMSETLKVERKLSDIIAAKADTTVPEASCLDRELNNPEFREAYKKETETLAKAEAELFAAQQALLTEGQARNTAEAERDRLAECCKDLPDRWYSEQTMKAVADERDDLRRKLEEANLENGRLLNDRKVFAQMLNESERERANASLSNAALRGAGEALMNYERAMEGADGCGENDDLYWKAVKLTRAALALPADGLAEEVKAVLLNARSWCPKDSGAAADIDALLTKLGARP